MAAPNGAAPAGPTLATKTAPHLAWILAGSAPTELAAGITAAASPEALGVTPEVPDGVAIKGRAKGDGALGGGAGGAITGTDGGAGDEAMADVAKAPADTLDAEAAAAEAAVDAAGDGRDGALG
jgi:hypothetical protein